MQAAWRRLLYDSDGVTSTEYAVVLALILGVCTTSINCLGLRTAQTFQNAGNAMQSGASQSGSTGS